MKNIWETLKIEPTSDKRKIKKAYAVLLKKTNPEDNAAAYQQLREAYSQALAATASMEQQQKPGNNHPTDISAGPINTLQKNETLDQENYTASDSEVVMPPYQGYFNNSQQYNYSNPSAKIIHRLVKNIFNQIDYGNQENAIIAFKKLLQNSDYESIDSQYQIEGELLVQFGTRKTTPEQLLLAVAEYYNWDNSDNPFKYDLTYRNYYYLITQLYQQIKISTAIRKYMPDLTNKEWEELSPAIFGPLDKDLLFTIFNSDLYYQFNKIITYLNQQKRFLDTGIITIEAIDWWYRLQGKQSTPNKKRASSAAPWFLYVIVFMIIGSLARVATNKDSFDYEQFIPVEKSQEINRIIQSGTPGNFNNPLNTPADKLREKSNLNNSIRDTRYPAYKNNTYRHSESKLSSSDSKQYKDDATNNDISLDLKEPQSDREEFDPYKANDKKYYEKMRRLNTGDYY